MALVITPTPSISGYIYADETVSLALSGSSTGILWNSLQGGSFSDWFAENPVFTPANRTGIDTVTGLRAPTLFNTWISVSNFTQTSTYDLTMTKTGAGFVWDASALTPGHSGGSNVLFEFSTSENNLEKSGGLTDNASNPNPTATTYRYAWHLHQNGLAYPRWKGALQANPLPYKAFDRFRITKTGNTVVYSLNGQTIATVNETPGTYMLYGVITAYMTGATIVRPFYYIDDPATKGTYTLNVYGVFPVQPNFNYEMNPINNVLTSVAEDGTEVARKKGGIKQVLSLPFNNRPKWEIDALRAFWEYHDTYISFVYRDLYLEKNFFMKFATAPKFNPITPNIESANISLKEV